jgi:hypothetical protein
LTVVSTLCNDEDVCGTTTAATKFMTGSPGIVGIERHVVKVVAEPGSAGTTISLMGQEMPGHVLSC